MDYAKELENIQSGGSYWKPEKGQYKVKGLSEIELADPFVRKHEDGTEEKHEQVRLAVLVDGEEKVWTFGKGKTPASTYGQLVELATNKGNTLVNVEFTVIVKYDGTKNDYTIVA